MRKLMLSSHRSARFWGLKGKADANRLLRCHRSNSERMNCAGDVCTMPIGDFANSVDKILRVDFVNDIEEN